ncbi:MAG: response regulator transcription factor [Vulcanimicrobiota bacterium]
MSEVRILVIDDESAVRKFLRNCLQGAQYQVFEAPDAMSGVERIKKDRPDLVLLDIGLPDLTGIELTRLVREWTQLPIIIVSVRDQESDIVQALDAGADDYLSKPFSVTELLARIRAALRRGVREAGEPIFRSGGLEVDLEHRTVAVGGSPVQLTPTEYDLLKLLVTESGRVLTHQHILHKVWGKGYEQDLQILRVNISNLRKKIEQDPRHPQLLVTEPGVGYRLRLTS